MTEEKLKQTAAHQGSLMVSITALAKNKADAERAKKLLEGINLEQVLMETCSCYSDWLETLSEEPISGLAEACRSWIHHWGQGGGDCSTEDQIKSAIDDLESDSPKGLADAMYCAVAEYSKTPFEASVLVMDIMNECLPECQENAEGSK
jgi:hypothetical protein